MTGVAPDFWAACLHQITPAHLAQKYLRQVLGMINIRVVNIF